ncbi:hypothetical protein ACVKSY_001587 [Sphingomonas sp. PvP107]
MEGAAMKHSAFFDRPTFTHRDVRAGCFVCGGSDAIWIGGNAQGVAARHYDATKHVTWTDVYMCVRYGEDAADDRQTDIEDAIASASSGDRPGAAPLPDPDAPAVPAAGVSAPTKAALSKRALAAAKPEPSNV